MEEQLATGEVAPDALIYLTDGYGPYPDGEPMFPVLWVLSEDGIDDRSVPFGSVIRTPRLVGQA